MFETKNSNMQGNIGLGRAIAFFTRIGAIVSLPLNDSQAYDLVIDSGTLCRVQVKTTSQKSKNDRVFLVKLESCCHNFRKNFDSSASDLLFVLTSDNTAYCIPTDVILVKTSLHLDERFDKYITGG
jgi:hypothetical protein